MKLYVFNPDADMALGNNEENYMAPASIRRMAEDLALLPVWYAQPGSGVLAPSAYNADYLKRMQQLLPLPVRLVTEPELPDYAEAQVMPWGWNPAIRKRMLKGGIAAYKLPTLENLQEYRGLASRIHTLALFMLFNYDKLDFVCGYCRLIEGDGKVFPAEAVDDLRDGYLFKALWSGSGKGLCWCRGKLSKSVSDWCCHTMKEYGAVMVEPIYNKVEDFAMEFYSDGRGKVLFVGYSRFTTNEHGAYCGNILTSDGKVEEWIQQYVPLESFIRIRERLLNGLEKIYGNSYTGYLGVDMMVCRQESGYPYAIHPHVEVNLRMNMGVVAHRISNDYLSAGCSGYFSIDSYPSNEALQAQHAQDVHDYPLVVQDGKVKAGYLPLVPVTSKSRYRAYIKVSD